MGRDGLPSMDSQVLDFFSQYDQANQNSNLTAFEKLYAVRFMLVGPKGSHVVERDAFLTIIPKMKAKLSAMGLAARRIKTVESYPLDSKHLLAKVGWQMVVESPTGNKELEALATFVLLRGEENALSIIFQLDHQDLSELVTSRQESA